jgi:ribosomal protein L32
MAKRKRTKKLHRKLKIEQHETPIKTGELRYSGRISSSCSTSDTRRVAPVTNPVIRHD